MGNPTQQPPISYLYPVASHCFLPKTNTMAYQQVAISNDHPQRQSVEQFKYSKRVVLKSILGREDGGADLVGERLVVGGWVRSRKEKAEQAVPEKSKVAAGKEKEEVQLGTCCCESLMSRIPLFRIMFRRWPYPGKPVAEPSKKGPAVVYLRINDGSCVANLQLVVDTSMSLLGQVMSVGTSVLVEGVLEQSLVKGKHGVQLKVDKILHAGIADPKTYPLAKANLSLEFLRAYPHLRPRAATVASITRVRNTLSYATHMFFQNNGVLYVHMPIITTTDLRNCSKMFHVTTLFSKADDMEKPTTMNDREVVTPKAVRDAIKEKSKRIEELKRSDSNREALLQALQDLQKVNELALQLEDQQKSSPSEVGKLDFSKDFFSRPAYLSVSAALHLESYACALSSVYTFGPIFRAECSQSSKQLAEMWMVEVELAFAELEEVMNCAEDFLKFICQSILDNRSDDLKLISKKLGNNCLDHLQSMMSSPFARITYTEALETLKKEQNRAFEAKMEWGINLSNEHESYLADEIYKRPIILYEYPKEVKPFYTRIKDDGRTVSAFDVIAPKVGVLIRGSQKEERIDMISARIDELGLPREHYEWYMDLRRHGGVKHAGFSLGFENIFMLTTGLGDMRDAIPFPRTHGSSNT